jgi:hypothetical protein
VLVVSSRIVENRRHCDARMNGVWRRMDNLDMTFLSNQSGAALPIFR